MNAASSLIYALKQHREWRSWRGVEPTLPPTAPAPAPVPASAHAAARDCQGAAFARALPFVITPWGVGAPSAVTSFCMHVVTKDRGNGPFCMHVCICECRLR